jgi:serine/threonine protein kinase/tetratricopeptide (TPR) repeat protein
MSVTASPQPEPNGELTPIDPADAYRFERVRVVLGELMELPAGHRMARLDELAGSDPPLRAAVAELLALAEAADRAGFLDAGVDEEDDGPARDTPDPLPERIGPYRVLARLGEGGTGVVYLGESPAPMHRRAAVKLSRSSLRGQAAYRADVEAEALASFNHPGIAQVFETGVLDDGRRWTACELVDGDWISRGSAARGWRASVELLAQAAEAVHHTHQRGVVHRDLKPSNLLVEHDAKTPRVKVIDFGVARLLTPRNGADAVTEPGLLVGTLAYMSPEQLGAGDVDARTDVYGLGLVACEVLTGKPPPGRSGGLAELMTASKLRGCPKLTGCGGHERDLEAVIAKATDPEPGTRYPSMQHLADDLRRVLASEPVSARRPGPLWRLRLYTTRHPVFSGLSVVVVLVIVSLVAALSASRGDLAEEVREQQQLVGDLVNETLVGLREVRGTRESRLAIVERLMDRVERNASDNPDNLQLQLVLARTLRERGDIRAGIGQLDEAERDLVRSLAIYAEANRVTPDDVELGRLHAEGIVRVGDIELERNRGGAVSSSMDRYLRAMRLQEELLAKSLDHAGLLDDLSWSYDRIANLGDLYGASMPKGSIESWLLERIELSRRLVSLDPERILSHYSRGTGYMRLARHYGYNDRPEDCTRAIAEGLQAVQYVLQAEPNRMPFVQILLELYVWDVKALIGMARYDEVPEAVQRLVDASRSQVNAQPGDLLAEESLVSALTLGANAMKQVGDHTRCRVFTEEAVARYEALQFLVSPARWAELQLGLEEMRTMLAELE